MTPFPSEKNFTSWLGVCPNNRKTGGRIRSAAPAVSTTEPHLLSVSPLSPFITPTPRSAATTAR